MEIVGIPVYPNIGNGIGAGSDGGAADVLDLGYSCLPRGYFVGFAVRGGNLNVKDSIGTKSRSGKGGGVAGIALGVKSYGRCVKG